MRRILICARAYPPDIGGGGEISTALIAEGLVDLGLDVRVLTLTDQTEQVETINGVRVERIPCPNLYWSLRSESQSAIRKTAWHLSQAFRQRPPAIIREAIHRSNPDLVHTSTIEDFGPGLWRWCRQQRIGSVHTLRSYTLLHRGSTLYDPKNDAQINRDWLSYSKQRLSHSLDGVIGISRFILEEHLRAGFFAGCQTTVIANPVEPPATSASDASSNMSAQQNSRGEAPQAVRIGILGRLSPEKGIGPLLGALRSIGQSPSWDLEIAGDGTPEHVSHLRQLASGMPVEFVGWQDSFVFLRGLDLLIVPSRWQEPFGRIVVEAFSVGLPVLSLRRGGLTELITEDVTGWLLNDWSESGIRRAIEGCRRIDRDTVTQISQNFAKASIAEQHRDFYQTLIRWRTTSPGSVGAGASSNLT